MAVTLDDLGGWRAVLLALTSRPRPHRRRGPGGHDRDPGRRRHRRPDRGLHRGPAHEGRGGRRGGRHGRGHARGVRPDHHPGRRRAAGRHRRHRRRADPARTTPSTCRPWPASSWPVRACTSASTATARPPPPAARSTCSRRSAWRIDLDGAGVARCVVEAGARLLLRPGLPPGHAPRRPGAGRAGHPHACSTSSARCRTRPGSTARSSASTTRPWRRP